MTPYLSFMTQLREFVTQCPPFRCLKTKTGLSMLNLKKGTIGLRNLSPTQDIQTTGI